MRRRQRQAQQIPLHRRRRRMRRDRGEQREQQARQEQRRVQAPVQGQLQKNQPAVPLERPVQLKEPLQWEQQREQAQRSVSAWPRPSSSWSPCRTTSRTLTPPKLRLPLWERAQPPPVQHRPVVAPAHGTTRASDAGKTHAGKGAITPQSNKNDAIVRASGERCKRSEEEEGRVGRGWGVEISC